MVNREGALKSFKSGDLDLVPDNEVPHCNKTETSTRKKTQLKGVLQ